MKNSLSSIVELRKFALFEPTFSLKVYTKQTPYLMIFDKGYNNMA